MINRITTQMCRPNLYLVIPMHAFGAIDVHMNRATRQ
jgi:hypothetical protein